MKNSITAVNQYNYTEIKSTDLFNSEVGTLIFRSALLKYIASEKEEIVQEFETFINLQVKAEDFIERLCEKYPTFAEVLSSEMKFFSKELSEIF